MQYYLLVKLSFHNNKYKFCLLVSLLCLLSACQKSSEPNFLTVEPSFLGHHINCEQTININTQGWHVRQLQFYLANIEGQSKQGLWQKLPMKVTPFQSSNVALIGSNCQQANTEHNWQVKFQESFNAANYNRIRFTLGVPFEFNHINPLQQQSPLNLPSMFWVWRSGHKFLRLELLSENRESWMFHLGSTGCQSMSPVRAPITPCTNPNQARVELPMPADSKLRFNLSALLKNLQLSDNTSCQSSPNNNNCRPLFERFGLLKNNQMEQVVFEVNNRAL